MDEILESDDYSEDVSDEENYAGGYGGYDDLYDDLIDQAGYDPWDISSDSGKYITEHNFDEEWPLFDNFDFYRKIDSNSSKTIKSGIEIMKMDHKEKEIFLSSISYAKVLRLAIQFQEMCEAWRLRRDKKMMSHEEFKRTYVTLVSEENKDLFLNLYQIELSDRLLARDYSVYRLVEFLGDESDVDIFFKEISTSVNLLKSIIFMIIRTCLPHMISSIRPVVDQVLEHLIVNKGLDYIGFVSQEKSRQLVEAKYLTSLYDELKALYGRLRDVMFLQPDPNLVINFARRQNFRAHVYVLSTFLDEEIVLEDGGWTHKPDWEKDLIEINNTTEKEIKAMKDVFKSYTCIFN